MGHSDGRVGLPGGGRVHHHSARLLDREGPDHLCTKNPGGFRAGIKVACFFFCVAKLSYRLDSQRVSWGWGFQMDVFPSRNYPRCVDVGAVASTIQNYKITKLQHYNITQMISKLQKIWRKARECQNIGPQRDGALFGALVRRERGEEATKHTAEREVKFDEARLLEGVTGSKGGSGRARSLDCCEECVWCPEDQHLVHGRHEAAPHSRHIFISRGGA